MSHRPNIVPPNMPLVVQFGFAGSRELLKKGEHPGVDQSDFYARVEEHLCGVLRELPRALGLSEKHFLCGVSQIAIGADTIFTRACMRLGFLQRIFLPEHRDAYFAAADKDGERDFADAEVRVAEELLRDAHIIEERVVSNSAKRSERFEDVNLDLVRVSDVLVALRRADAPGKIGGTMDLIERAGVRHRPLLEITVSVRDGHPFFAEKWHPNKPPDADKDAPLLGVPGIPPVLAACHAPGGDGFAPALKEFAGARAQRNQWFFIWAAFVIVGTHFFATFCSGWGLAFHGKAGDIPPRLLVAELLLLFIGFCFHGWLHRSRTGEQWAIARLVSEIARSVTSMSKVPGYLGHLFVLPVPELLRPLMRTLNVFHLDATRGMDPSGWSDRRDAYIHERLTREPGGQIPYYRKHYRRACCRLCAANLAFYIGSMLAFVAALTELLDKSDYLRARCPCAVIGWLDQYAETLGHWPAFLAIILPVLAVAALSLAASFDLEARKHTYREMVAALKQHKGHIEHAKSEHEFVHLVLLIETRLVGENVNWFSRRVFTGVT
ncbi:MAG: hypothetical protein ABI318_09330 [Chthoniobacteraceae bacterium]